MENKHTQSPDSSFDGGDLDCGSGLLLLIRRHIDPLAAGQTLEILSTDATVEVDLPAWCRMTGNDLVRWKSARAGKTVIWCARAHRSSVAPRLRRWWRFRYPNRRRSKLNPSVRCR